jgi:hypothetical protein
MVDKVRYCNCSVDFFASGIGSVAADNSRIQRPLRSLKVTLIEGTQNAFLDRLEMFANVHAFAVRMARIHPDRIQFSIEFWREDIKLYGANAPDDLVFEMSFYKVCNVPVNPAVLNSLISDLRKAVGQVNGATVSEIN